MRCPRPPAEINRALLERGIIGGLDVSDQIPGGLLLCVTELNTREEIDALVEGLAAVTLSPPKADEGSGVAGASPSAPDSSPAGSE